MSRGYRVTHRNTVNQGTVEPEVDCGVNSGYKSIKIIVFTFTGRYILCTENFRETYGDVKKALLPEIIPKSLDNQKRKILFFENPNNRPVIDPKDEIPDDRPLPQEGPIEIQLLVEDEWPPYHLTKESILSEIRRIMENKTFYESLVSVGKETKEYYKSLIEDSEKTREEKEIAIVKFNILETYSIMSLLEYNLINYEPYNSATLYEMLNQFRFAVLVGDVRDIAGIILYYNDCFEQKVKVV